MGLLLTYVGAGGIAVAWADSLVSWFGLNRVHLAFRWLLAAGIRAVGSAVTTPALTGGAAFGAAGVMLTGVYLLWGVRALAHRRAAGLMIGFLKTGVGQTVQTAGVLVFGLHCGCVRGGAGCPILRLPRSGGWGIQCVWGADH